MKINRRKVFSWTKIVIIVYCLIGIALYYLQERFLFHPEKLDKNYQYHFDRPFEEVMIPVNKEDTISLVKFFPADSLRKGVVLYYHGNRKNIGHYAAYAGIFLKHGYEVWMADYPGFGKTTGVRTEKKMYEQALIVQQLAASRYSGDSIIIYGKSLGTGIATYVAANTRSRALVLETPYYSIPSLFAHYAMIYPVSYMATYKIPAYQYMADVKAPVLIFHGTGDDVIPLSNAEKLKPYLKKGDRFIVIKGGGHNTLGNFPEFNAALDSLLQ
jgi:hypothetical protein